MFSFQQISKVQSARTRGSPLLSRLASHVQSGDDRSANCLRDPLTLRIHRVHHIHSSHFAVELDQGRMCVLLDSVPESVMDSTANETLSNRLFDELVKIQTHVNSIHNIDTRVDEQSGVGVGGGSVSPHATVAHDTMGASSAKGSAPQRNRAAIHQLKSNLTKMFNKSSPSSSSISSPTSADGSNPSAFRGQQSSTDTSTSASAMSIPSLRPTFDGGVYQIKSDHDVLAIYDPEAPLVACYFDERDESNTDDIMGGDTAERRKFYSAEREVTRFFALQANGTLWSWKWDSAQYRWVSCGFSHVHLRQQQLQLPSPQQWDVNIHSKNVKSALQSNLSRSIHLNCAQLCMMETRWIVWSQTLGSRQPTLDNVTRSTSIDISQRPGIFCREIILNQSNDAQKEWIGLGPPIELAAQKDFDCYNSNAPRMIDSGDIFEILCAREGVWVLCREQIHYVPIQDTDHLHSNSSIHVRESSSSSSDGSLSLFGKSYPPLFTAYARHIRYTSLDTPVYSFSYCAHTVHPLTGQLLLLGVDGLLRLSPIPSSFDKSTSIIMMHTVQTQVTKTGIEEHVNHYSSLAASSSALRLDSMATMEDVRALELFFICDTLFAITNGEVCMIYESKDFTLLQQVHLPSDIAMDDEKKSTVTCTQCLPYPDRGAGSAFVKCGTGIFRIKTPALREILRDSIEHGGTRQFFTQRQRHRQQQRQEQQQAQQNRKLAKMFTTLAEISREYGLENWEAKYLLDLVGTLQYEHTKPTKSSSTHTEVDIERPIAEDRWHAMEQLCNLLQSPSLAWISADSLVEQNRLIDRVTHFIRHFPQPDSSFWKKEKRKELSNILPHLSHWDCILDTSDIRDITSEKRFKLLTPLNLSVFNTLAESVALSRHQLNSLSFSGANLGIVSTAEIDPVTQSSIHINALDLTDVELKELARTHPKVVLAALCRFCGLEDSIFKALRERTIMDAKEIELYVNDHYEKIHACLLFDDDTDYIITASNNTSPVSRLANNEVEWKKITANEVEGSPLYFDILCQLLFNYHESNDKVTEHTVDKSRITSSSSAGRYSYLICVLIIMIDKLKKQYLHIEKLWLDDKNRKKSSSLEELNRLQFQLHFKSEINYRSLYAQRVLDCIELTRFDQDDKSHDNQPSYSQFQTSTISCLYYWSDQKIEAIKLLLAENMVPEAITTIQHQYHQNLSLDNNNNFGENDQNSIDECQTEHGRLLSMMSSGSFQGQHEGIEELYEIIHVLTRYTFADQSPDNDRNQRRLKDLLKRLLPISYNVFDFFKALDTAHRMGPDDCYTIPQATPTYDQQQTNEDSIVQSIFSTVSEDMPLEKLLPVLQQFAEHSKYID